MSIKDSLTHYLKQTNKSKFKGKFTTWVDNIGFLNIFIIWTAVIVVFGFLYFYLPDDTSFLYNSLERSVIEKIGDAMYFSFGTATITGVGGIVPIGREFQFYSVIEVLFALFLLAFFTSKLVSIKQDIIISEIYEISFNERINRIRSSLLLFRQQIARAIEHTEDHTIKKREVDDLYANFSSFESYLEEILNLFKKKDKHSFIKMPSQLNTSLILNSVTLSFTKTGDLLEILEQNNLEWKRDLTVRLIYNCISLNEAIFRRVQEANILDKPSLRSFMLENDHAVKRVMPLLPPETREIL